MKSIVTNVVALKGKETECGTQGYSKANCLDIAAQPSEKGVDYCIIQTMANCPPNSC